MKLIQPKRAVVEAVRPGVPGREYALVMSATSVFVAILVVVRTEVKHGQHAPRVRALLVRVN